MFDRLKLKFLIAQETFSFLTESTVNGISEIFDKQLD